MTKQFNKTLLDQFNQRVQLAQKQKENGEEITAFSQGITGTSTLRLMGQSGDAQIHFPLITDLAVVDTLAEDEREALFAAQAGVQEHYALGRSILRAQPGQPEIELGQERMSWLDATDQSLLGFQLIVVKPVSGG